MDYSLLVGIHDKARAEEEVLQQEAQARDGSGASGSGANAACGANRETSESEECDSGERWTYNTPPDSPRCVANCKEIIQDIDIYAVDSTEGKSPLLITPYRVFFFNPATGSQSNARSTLWPSSTC